MRKLVTIRQADKVEHHPNADALDLVEIGGYLLFFGGIVQVLSSISPLVTIGIAVSAVKIISASFVGVLLFVISCVVGDALIRDA